MAGCQRASSPSAVTSPRAASAEIAGAGTRQIGLTVLASECFTATNTAVYRVQFGSSQNVPGVIRALASHRIVTAAQANYTYELAQDAQTRTPHPDQYVIEKLRLSEIHQTYTGANVSIAVIDFEIDASHPDLAGAVANRFDAAGTTDAPHPHGTGMAGAIAARRTCSASRRGAACSRCAPSAPGGDAPRAPPSTSSRGSIGRSSKGARIINMSFAGPRDPRLREARSRRPRQGHRADRGRRQCRAEFAAALSGRRSQCDRGHRDRHRRQLFPAPIAAAISRSRRRASTSWCRRPTAPTSSPPAPRLRPPMSAASWRCCSSAIRAHAGRDRRILTRAPRSSVPTPTSAPASSIRSRLWTSPLRRRPPHRHRRRPSRLLRPPRRQPVQRLRRGRASLLRRVRGRRSHRRLPRGRRRSAPRLERGQGRSAGGAAARSSRTSHWRPRRRRGGSRLARAIERVQCQGVNSNALSDGLPGPLCLR